jgi:hypothetical protein
MDSCVDIVKARRRQSLRGALQGLMESYDQSYGRATEIAEEYFRLMDEDPKQGIDKLLGYLHSVRIINPAYAFVEGIAGGPNQDWTAPLLNALGAVYPYLERETRRAGLIRSLNFLDGLKYTYSQNHVELIHEPWLFADIIINRGLYWPGHEEESAILGQARTWESFRTHLPRRRSQFILAFAVLKHQVSSLEVRARFYKEYPDLTDRALDGVAAIVNAEVRADERPEGIPYHAALTNLLSNYDPLWHEAIRSKIQEEKWIRLDF